MTFTTLSPMLSPVGRTGRMLATLLALTPALGAAGAGAHDYTLGDLTIDHPWSRATAPNARTGALYLEIVNGGAADDRLVAIRGEVSERIELHTMEIDNQGIMRMREVEGGVAVPAGETVALESGGYHGMLVGLEENLTEGQTFPVTLVFQQAGEVEVEVHVEGVGSPGSGHGSGHGGDQDHGDRGGHGH